MDANTQEAQVQAWIERGKQVGKSLCVERDGRRIYLRVAIHKQSERYKVIVDEIDEARMEAEVFEREGERMFDAVADAMAFIEGTTPVAVADLRPSKGQKWF